jgi:hypothetical protein
MASWIDVGCKNDTVQAKRNGPTALNAACSKRGCYN